MTNKSLLDIPDSYSTFEETLQVADSMLSDAVDNSKTLFHTLVVFSFDGSKISSRVMDLIELDINKRIMIFHTDYMAPKIKQFSNKFTGSKVINCFISISI